MEKERFIADFDSSFDGLDVYPLLETPKNIYKSYVSTQFKASSYVFALLLLFVAGFLGISGFFSWYSWVLIGTGILVLSFIFTLNWVRKHDSVNDYFDPVGSMKLMENEIIVLTKEGEEKYPFNELQKISVYLHKGLKPQGMFFKDSFKDARALMICLTYRGKKRHLFVQNNNFGQENTGRLTEHLDTLKNTSVFMHRLIQFYL